MKAVLQNKPERKPNRYLECFRKVKKKYPKMYIKKLKEKATLVYKGKLKVEEL